MIKSFKLWLYLHNEDIKSFLKNGIPFLIGICLLLYSPGLIRSFMLNKLDSTTFGIVDSLIEYEGILESETGGKLVTMNYQIQYYYFIEGKRLSKKENIYFTSINTKEKIILKKLNHGDTISVNFNSKIPEKSMLKILP